MSLLALSPGCSLVARCIRGNLLGCVFARDSRRSALTEYWSTWFSCTRVVGQSPASSARSPNSVGYQLFASEIVSAYGPKPRRGASDSVASEGTKTFWSTSMSIATCHLVRCFSPTGPFSRETGPPAGPIPLYGPCLCLGHPVVHRHPIARADVRSDALRLDEAPGSGRPFVSAATYIPQGILSLVWSVKALSAFDTRHMFLLRGSPLGQRK